MIGTLYVICPSTKEICPYIYDQDDHFSLIIDDLQRKGKPNCLFYYNGQESIYLLAKHPIKLFFPARYSQVMILAISKPISPLPILNLPDNHDLLLFFLKWDLSQVIPYIVTGNETIKSLILEINQRYNLKVSLTKLVNGSTYDIMNLEQTIFDLLPWRTDQILFLLNDDHSKSSIDCNHLEKSVNGNYQNNNISNNHSDKSVNNILQLPMELILNIVRRMPLSDILGLSQVSHEFNQICNNDLLWQKLIERDFRVSYFSSNSNYNKWKDKYKLMYKSNLDDLLALCLNNDNLDLIKYVVLTYDYDQILLWINKSSSWMKIEEKYQKLIRDIISLLDNLENWHKSLIKFISYGHTSLVKIIMYEMRKRYILYNHDKLLGEAAYHKRRELVRTILREMRNRDINPDYHYLLERAVLGADKVIITIFLTRMFRHNIKPDYCRMLQITDKKEIVEMMVNIMKFERLA